MIYIGQHLSIDMCVYPNSPIVLPVFKLFRPPIAEFFKTLLIVVDNVVNRVAIKHTTRSAQAAVSLL